MKQHNIGAWFEIYVNDMKRAKNFYQHVFELSGFTNQSTLDWDINVFKWHKKAEGIGGALIKANFNQPSKIGTIIYFNCDDCAIHLEKADEMKAEILVPKTPLAHFGYSAIIRDSEGNLIGLYSLK